MPKTMEFCNRVPDGIEGFMLEVVTFLGNTEPANPRGANRPRDRA